MDGPTRQLNTGRTTHNNERDEIIFSYKVRVREEVWGTCSRTVASDAPVYLRMVVENTMKIEGNWSPGGALKSTTK